MSVTVEGLIAQSRAATEPTEARRLRVQAFEQMQQEKKAQRELVLAAKLAAMPPEDRAKVERIRANYAETLRQREVATVLLETQPVGDGLPFPE